MDFAAGLSELLGSWLLGNKSRLGFVLNAVGCSLWIVVSLRSELYGLLLIAVPGVFVNVRNYRQWKQ